MNLRSTNRAAEQPRIHPGDVRTPRPPKEEIASLTSIRGIFASWVVFSHFSPAIFLVLPEVSFMEPLVDAAGSAMLLFFVLSGYIMGLRYLTRLTSPTARTVVRFLWLRLGRIYPVHIFTLALVSLVLVTNRGWHVTDEEHTLGTFITNCLLTNAWEYNFRLSWNPASWSISCEWFAYLIFPLVAVVVARLSRIWVLVLVAVACGVSAGTYAFLERLQFQRLALVVPTFIGGVGLAIVCRPGGLTARVRHWSALCLLVAISLPFAIGPGPLLRALYLPLFFILVGLLGISGDQSTAFWRSGPLVYLGEISYSLYMTHVIVMVPIARFLPFEALQGQPIALRIVALLSCLVVILGAAAAVYYGVERPARILVRGRLSTRPRVGNP